jgi:biopolymer transport protein ExbD
MSKHKLPPVKEDISPNLIPMIDIMFLLLLFFMLGADMTQREFAEVVLPIADRVKEDDNTNDTSAPQTTININHDASITCALADNGGICREAGHWLWNIRGKPYDKTTIGKQLQIEAEESLEDTVDPNAKKRLSKRKATIRADKDAPYGDIQKVIELAGLAGIYKIEIAAAKPAPKPGT